MSDPITPLTPAQQAIQEAQASKEGFVKRNLIAIDDLGNTLTGGHNDETISARTARDAEQGRWLGKVISRGLNLFQKNHGAKAIAGDLERAQTIVQVEESDPVIAK